MEASSSTRQGHSQQPQRPEKSSKKLVGIVLFDRVEVLDYCGPYEVFSVTRVDDDPSLLPNGNSRFGFDVILIGASEDGKPIKTTGGMEVMPQATLEDCPPLDILLIPGGRGTRDLGQHKQAIIDFILRNASDPRLEVLASVCTGALVLGEAGLLDGKRATTHYASLEVLQSKFPSVTVDRDKHWVVFEPSDGDSSDANLQNYTLFTSAGISAGIDMTLKVVQHVYGEDIARRTARHMEYPFPESQERRIDL